MYWVLFDNAIPGATAPYHHTIDGQVFTAVVIILLALSVLYCAYRNFILGKPTGEVLR